MLAKLNAFALVGIDVTLTWNDGTAPRIAEGTYEGRRMPERRSPASPPVPMPFRTSVATARS
jgi:hypothetical protein